MNDLYLNFYEEWHKSAGNNRAIEIRDRDILALEYLNDCNAVFELGCGSGTVLNMCNAKFKAGVDISEEAIKNAGEIVLNGEKIELKVNNIDKEELPFQKEMFDGCMAIEVLEHLFDPVHALAEMNRILKKNGKICVTVPNIGYFKYRFYHLFTGEVSDFHGNGMIVNEHIRYYGVKTISLLLHLTGFKVVNIKGAMKQVIQPQKKNAQKKNSSHLLIRIIKALKPTPTNIMARFNAILKLWSKYPSLFAVGIVVEAVKIEDPKYKYNGAIDHQVRKNEDYDNNVNNV